ncbi:MAG: 6-phosphofructokinase, partial [Eubacterium sp.]|nr:6-phosphofructokinase [Eubacterium sp.]
MSRKRIGVLTSGGDSPGMNAAIRSAVRYAIEKGMEVYGIHRGYEGLLEGDIHEMTRNSVADILQKGGTILKTARSKRFMTPEGLDHAVEVLEAFGIDAVVIIGGDGSMRGGLDLTKRGVTVMGVPGTIDNDLGYTDYTIGFDTAVTTCLDAITKLRDTSSAHDRAFIIEVMGRRCGDIAMYAGLAGGAEDVLVPELPYDVNELCKKIIQSANRGKRHNIIIKAEGVDVSSQDLAHEIERKTGRETRLVVLSYLQRGGSPTMRDRLLATLCAQKAVDLIDKGSQSKAIGTVNGHIVA